MKPAEYSHHVYARPTEQLILRDVLAIDRTRLANERMLLAWIRTAVMLLVSGITLIKLFEGIAVMEILGSLLIPAGLLTAALGIHRYFSTRNLIDIPETQISAEIPQTS